MNTMPLQDLVRGVYGRKIAYVNYDEVNEGNILKILSEGVKAHNWNKAIIKYLKDYMKGDCPARYRTKSIRDDVINHVVENHAWEIVQFKNAQTNAEPIQYISINKDELITKAIEKLNTYVRVSHKHKKDIDAGEWTSCVGTAYKAVQRTNDVNSPFRIVAPSPMNTFVIYSANTEEPLLAVQELKDENNRSYWLCFDKKFEYRVQGGKLITQYDADGIEYTRKLHMFADIPIVEFPNNADRISDIELVIDLLDAINNMQSNRMDAVEQFVQSFFKFVNCDIDQTTFDAMKASGAFSVKSTSGDNKADVDLITQELSQTETQVAKQDLWDNVLSILAIPTQQENSGGDTMGAVELRNGWSFAKSRALIKDQYVIDAEMRLAKVMVGVINYAKGADECPITELDFSAQIIHNPTDNLVARVNALSQLLATGIHPKIAIEKVDMWSDCERVYAMSKETIDKKQYSETQNQQTVVDEVITE